MSNIVPGDSDASRRIVADIHTLVWIRGSDVTFGLLSSGARLSFHICEIASRTIDSAVYCE